MANTVQAKKRIIQSEKHRHHNVGMRSAYRTSIKKVLSAIGEQKKSLAVDTYKLAVSVIDKMVCKGILHKNKAARHKSRLFAKIKQLTD